MAHDLELSTFHGFHIVQEDNSGVSNGVVMPDINGTFVTIDAQVDLEMWMNESWFDLLNRQVPEESLKMMGGEPALHRQWFENDPKALGIAADREPRVTCSRGLWGRFYCLENYKFRSFPRA